MRNGEEVKNSLLAYRISAIEGATHLDVLLACYDGLAEDIRLAGRAAVAGDIVARCRYSQHAILVLGHLQDWVPLLENKAVEQSLTAFYEYLRKTLLFLQASTHASEYVALAMTVCETRAVWQKKKAIILSSQPPAGPEVTSAPSMALYG